MQGAMPNLRMSFRAMMSLHCLGEETRRLIEQAAEKAGMDLGEPQNVSIETISDSLDRLLPHFVSALEERRDRRMEELHWKRTQNVDAEIKYFLMLRINEFFRFRIAIIDAFAISNGVDTRPILEAHNLGVPKSAEIIPLHSRPE